jgi:hypothetical protein
MESTRWLNMTETKPTRGGARAGAGRPRGSVNKRSEEIEAKLQALGCDPAEGLAKIASEAWAEGDKDLAARCFTSLLPYIFPKLKISEISIAQVDAAERILQARQRLRDLRAGIEKIPAVTDAGRDAVVLDYVPVPVAPPEPVHAEPAPVLAAPPAPPPPRPVAGLPQWVMRPPQPAAQTFADHADHAYNPYSKD